VLLLEIPEDWDAVCRADPSLARQWQLVVRRALEALFARGYTAVDCVDGRDGGRPRALYVLQKGPLEA
jgi:predicted GNAT superfamily acetyltransferase